MIYRSNQTVAARSEYPRSWVPTSWYKPCVHIPLRVSDRRKMTARAISPRRDRSGPTERSRTRAISYGGLVALKHPSSSSDEQRSIQYWTAGEESIRSRNSRFNDEGNRSSACHPSSEGGSTYEPHGHDLLWCQSQQHILPKFSGELSVVWRRGLWHSGRGRGKAAGRRRPLVLARVYDGYNYTTSSFRCL